MTLSKRRIGFGDEDEVSSLREENARLRVELEQRDAETTKLRAAVDALTDLVTDEDGALYLRSDPGGPRFCPACASRGRQVGLITEAGGARYHCVACGSRWIRPSREGAFMRAIENATQMPSRISNRASGRRPARR